jgi:putative cardiolipin synthase
MPVYLKALLGTSLLLGSLFAHAGEFGEYPYYKVSKATGKVDNKMMIIDSGVAALHKRMDMIRRAKKTLELEYFIYEPDLSGKILSTELIKKAKEGVKVRVLLDKSITVIRFDEYYAREFEKYGIDLKYYNRGMDPITAQFRNHRKLIVMDDQEAIVGGRNIGLEYFDLHPEFNYHDRDVWVKGPIVKAMVDSFEEFWKHPTSIEVPHATISEFSRLHRGTMRRDDVRYRAHLEREKEAAAFFKEDKELIDAKNRTNKIGGDIIASSKIHSCPKAVFATDKPGGSFSNQVQFKKYRKEYRHLSTYLRHKLANVKESLILDSPYFMLNQETDKLLKQILADKKDLFIYSNTLHATDALYVSANFYRIIWDLIDLGAVVYGHDGRFYNETDTVYPETKNVRYGNHAKTMVFDDDTIAIGSYNVDNRSDFYNTEMVVFCEGNKELADELKEHIFFRAYNGIKFTEKEHGIDSKGKNVSAFGSASEKTIKLMKAIKLPSKWLEFLM